MADSTYDIDSIVQKVLEAIRANRAGNACATGNATTQSTKSRATQDGSRLTLASRVVTLEQIEGRLDGIRQLIVPWRAVVTPSARDLLRQYDVALTFAAEDGERPAGKPAASDAKAPRLDLVAAVLIDAGHATINKGDAKFDLGSLARALATDGIDVEPSSSNCLMETTGRLAARFDDDRDDGDDGALGAIITSHPAAALCLANRLPGVRAVCPAAPSDVLSAVNDVGANLIVIDPAARGIFQIKQMIREFCLSGRHTCPEVLAARLR